MKFSLLADDMIPSGSILLFFFLQENMRTQQTYKGVAPLQRAILYKR